MARPLFDIVADFTAGPPNIPGTNAVSLNAVSGTRTQDWSIRRGRTYELGNAEAGVMTLNVFDRGENLNPVNASSPWNTSGNSLLPYRCIQRAAFWNAATQDLTGNTLNASNQVPGQPTLAAAYGIDPSFESWYVAQGKTAGTTFATSTDHADGSFTVWKTTVASSTDTLFYYPKFTPGTASTIRVDIWAATGLVVQVGWNGATPVTTTITGNNAFQTATLNFTPGTADRQASLYLAAPSAGTYPATFYVANFVLTTLPPGMSSSGSPTVQFSGAFPHSGAYGLAISAPGSSNGLTLPIWTVPNTVYTMTAYVAAQGAGTVATMAIGTATASTTTTGAYQRLTITFTALNAVTKVTWSVTGSSYPAVYYVDDIQLEIALAASAFTTSGPKRYARFTGYIERYPQTWVDAGFRGMKPLEAVDALSVLSRTAINQSYQTTVLADGPYAYVPFSDKAPPFGVQLPKGGQLYLGGTLLGNNSGSVNFGGDTFLDGSSAATVVQQNATPVISGNPAYITYAIARGGLLTMNPQAFTIECWVKVTSGTPYIGAAALTPTESPGGEALGPSYYIGWYTSAGKLTWHYSDPNGGANSGTTFGASPWNGYPDGSWHHIAVIMLGSNTATFAVDGSVWPSPSTLASAPSTAVGLNALFVDATTYFGDPATEISVANMALYPYVLSNSQIAKHYNRGAGYINEISGTRVARLVAQYWSSTNYSAAPGYIALAPDFNYDPVGNPASARTMLDVLQEISTTENGFIYANVSGAVVWEDRTTRVAQQTPIATIGQAANQIHYEALEYDYDPTYVYSQVNLSRPANSTYAPQVNATSQAAYGQRILSATLQVNTDFDLNQATIFYLNRYGNPGGAPGTTAGPRIRKLILNPAKDPSMWGFVLGLELSQRVTAKFTTSTGLLMSYDYYVENIVETGNPADGTYEVALQLSPVFVTNSWVLGDSTYGVLGTTTIPVY